VEARRKENPRGRFRRDEPLPGSPRRFTLRQRRLPGLKTGLMLLVGAVCVLPCAAQQSQLPGGILMAQNNRGQRALPPYPPNWVGIPTFNNMNRRLTKQRLTLMNEERQKSMVANAEKLLKLAKELNAEVNGAHAGALTEDQLRKVNEIEKLAHKVKSEMSYAVGRSPSMRRASPSVLFP